MAIKCLWIVAIIGLRLYLEDALCTGRQGFSQPEEIGHMALWWLSVIMAWLQTMVAIGKVRRDLALRLLVWTVPGICLPPLIDYPLRDFDYPYPNGDLAYYLRWMVGFMPHYVTLGQKAEILAMFAISAAVITYRTGFRNGLCFLPVIYLVLSLYAWFPAFFQWLWPWTRMHHDLFAIALLSLVIPIQILSLRRMP